MICSENLPVSLETMFSCRDIYPRNRCCGPRHRCGISSRHARQKVARPHRPALDPHSTDPHSTHKSNSKSNFIHRFLPLALLHCPLYRVPALWGWGRESARTVPCPSLWPRDVTADGSNSWTDAWSEIGKSCVISNGFFYMRFFMYFYIRRI